MYFNSSDLTKPKIRSVFKKFEHYYITEGFNNNYWYIYNETLIKLKPTDDANILDGEILESGSNYGDHIDFAIIKLKTGESVVKTHKTVYIDLGNFIFDRSVTNTCNFIFKESYIQNFNAIKAEISGVNSSMYIKDIYIPQDLYIINVFCNKMVGTIDKDKGGRRKKQLGGNIDSTIISDVIIKPLYAIRKDIMEVRIINKDQSGHIIVLIDFIEDTHGILLLKWPITNFDNIKKVLSTFAEK